MAQDLPDVVGWPVPVAIEKLSSTGWQVTALHQTRPPDTPPTEPSLGRVARVSVVGEGQVSLVYVVPPRTPAE